MPFFETAGMGNQLASAGLGAVSNIATSAFNIHENRQNRRFERDMANTAHQREVKDLRAAGLNPILSSKYGGSATPSTSAASAADPSFAATSAYSAVKQDKQQTGLIQAQTVKTLAEAKLANTSAETAEWSKFNERHITEADAALKMNQVLKSDAEVSTPLMKLYMRSLADMFDQTHSAAQLSRLKIPESKAMAKFYSGVGGTVSPWLNAAKNAAQTISPFSH